MRAAFLGASLYFAIAFAAGFALGTVRVLVLEPRLGAFAAVAIELPVMLWIAWASCALIIRRLGVPGTLNARLAMGLVAFALLALTETALSALAFGRSLAEQAADLQTAAGAIGLAGQILFAAVPALRLFAARRE